MGNVVCRATPSSDAMLFFMCPGCNTKHYIVVHPDAPEPRWKWCGSMERPNFYPSVLVRGVQQEGFRVRSGDEVEGGPYICHSFVKLGQIQFLNDCTHSMAGRTVPLPELPLPD